LVINNQGRECTTKEEVEVVCLQEKQACFNQAYDTPLFQEPICSFIGPIGDGAGVNSILQGAELSDDMIL